MINFINEFLSLDFLKVEYIDFIKHLAFYTFIGFVAAIFVVIIAFLFNRDWIKNIFLAISGILFCITGLALVLTCITIAIIPTYYFTIVLKDSLMYSVNLSELEIGLISALAVGTIFILILSISLKQMFKNKYMRTYE